MMEWAILKRPFKIRLLSRDCEIKLINNNKIMLKNSSSEVRMFTGSSTGINREVQDLAKEARRHSPRRSS